MSTENLKQQLEYFQQTLGPEHPQTLAVWDSYIESLIASYCIDEASAGFLIYYFELLTSATGIMLGINTYDQPGVEVGKRILKTMLTAGK